MSVKLIKSKRFNQESVENILRNGQVGRQNCGNDFFGIFLLSARNLDDFLLGCDRSQCWDWRGYFKRLI